MINFSDVFKNSFLQETGVLTISDFLMAMLSAFLCGIIIYFIYRYFYKGVVYNNNFNILLVMTSMVTCFIVIVISSNVVLSLGMVGALSIVRFRTAVKDPLDVGFLFWSVAVGITCGAGLYIISFLSCLSVGFVYILLVKIRSGKRVYLLIVKYDNSVFDEVARELVSLKKVLKNRTSYMNYTEITYQIRLTDGNTSFVSRLCEIKGVESATVVEFTGDYAE